MTVWLLPLTAILPQTSWDLLILPLYTHNLPLAGGIEPPTKGPHSPPPQAAGQPERFSRSEFKPIAEACPLNIFIEIGVYWDKVKFHESSSEASAGGFLCPRRSKSYLATNF
jgi:hypothetical protein